MTEIVFKPWPKTPRLYKDATLSEKLDGANACIIVDDEGNIGAQSRNRLIPLGPRGMDDVTWEKEDNHGFGAWVRENAEALASVLGPGHHFGEWWGHKINRGYGCEPGERYFSLFNTDKWEGVEKVGVPGLRTVPVLWRGPMDTERVESVRFYLQSHGSIAKPGFMKPEGLCVYHSASNQIYKYPFDKTQNDHLMSLVPDFLPPESVGVS